MVQEVSFVCSPLHDKDVLPTAKKKHTIMCCYVLDIKKSYEQVKGID